MNIKLCSFLKRTMNTLYRKLADVLLATDHKQKTNPKSKVYILKILQNYIRMFTLAKFLKLKP